jgi:uncharacterized membrane protein (UPF0182 family)
VAFRFYRGPEGEDLGPPPPPFRIGRRPAARLPFRGGWSRVLFVIVGIIIIYVVLSTLRGLYVDWLWFEGAGYRSIYSKMLATRVWLFFAGAGVFLAYFFPNVAYASRSLTAAGSGGLLEVDGAALGRLRLLALIAGSLFLAVIFGSVAAARWDVVLQFLNAERFGVEDPQFGRDIGFFVFTLPALGFFQSWLIGAAVLTVVIVAGVYLLRYLLMGVEGADARATKVHLSLLLVVVIGLFIWGYWLDRFDLLYSTRGAVFGAGYTDVNARLPVKYVLMGAAAVTALAVLANLPRKGIALPGIAIGGWVAIGAVGGLIYPETVQRFEVDPNELEKETPYIQRNIEMTRMAFGLDELEERPFPATLSVTLQEMEDNPDTIRNIRLLDVRPLLQTYSQIQSIRPLYRFLDVDVDRYFLDGVLRQVMLAPRELSPDRLPADAQSWVNKRLQFTHGYGIVMSPVNEVIDEGLPQLFMRDIPVMGKLPVHRPEIYYGEQPDHYVIVKTRAQEFDFPLGETSALTVFEGEGGVKLGSFFRKLVFAWHFGDLNIMISDQLTSESRILFRRNIQERVRTVAPFLILDNDPYIVIADGRFFWIQDAYTHTDRFPYSKPAPNGVTYIRNSVKVVIDAYDGEMRFYLFDEDDPIIRAYQRIFPSLLRPASEMPQSLRSHVRYPEDLFLTQVLQYLTYHIKDPQTLYNREDIWTIPRELFDDQEVPVDPYYVIMRIPGEPAPEFALILPLTPARVPNTIAWVAARSDGANYGKLLAFRFPTDTLVFGPRQVESRIDQDPGISAQFSLWNQSGSRVIRGNLLMMPIGEGNLFVEPVYLQSATSRLPELKRVVVVNGNRIAMEPTLEQSLNVVFGRAPSTLPGAGGAPLTGGPPPAATPTATPSEPRPTATPGGPALGVAELAREADAAYRRAQEALRRGDFGAYGVEIARVEELIRQIVLLTGGQ